MTPIDELNSAFIECIESVISDYLQEATRHTDIRTARDTAMGMLAGIVGTRCVIPFVSWDDSYMQLRQRKDSLHAGFNTGLEASHEAS
jgi:hypothetical protein